MNRVKAALYLTLVDLDNTYIYIYIHVFMYITWLEMVFHSLAKSLKGVCINIIKGECGGWDLSHV